jgi:hypothetical protein
VAAIDRAGALLVYPIARRKEPASLWSVLHPRSEMNWSWDETADPRIARLWHLRERLSRTRRVIYSKWYQNRAMFFSRELFSSMLTALAPWAQPRSAEATELLTLLEDNSPQTTKTLRLAAGLRGRDNAAVFARALRELWERLLIVGSGEAEDGGFPSLRVGATRWLFEDLWVEARSGDREDAERRVSDRLHENNAFLRQWQRIRRSLDSA